MQIQATPNAADANMQPDLPRSTPSDLPSMSVHFPFDLAIHAPKCIIYGKGGPYIITYGSCISILEEL
jgi:hypothetical protein